MLPYPDLAIGPADIICNKGPKPLHDKWLDAKSAEWLTEPTPVILGIDWPDFGLPKSLDGKEMPKEFWYALVEDIHTKGIKTISTQCMGGHGRTGVSLSILIYLLTPKEDREWTTLAELLAHVHKVYCDQAVEGDSQARYIAEVCGIEEGDYKLHHSRATGGWTGGGGLGNYAGYGGVHGGGVTHATTGSWCKKCKKMCDPKTVQAAVCDTCWDAANGIPPVSDESDDESDDELFKCDTCDKEYDSDIGICEACSIGQVLPVDNDKGTDEEDEGYALLGF